MLSGDKPDPDPQPSARQKRSPNRLVHEKSPYLLQHAYNPVDWYPWGNEAFSRAIQENKPVFLSIGYSTCHWCHVMARESFEDGDVAAVLNRGFISIKVDREERPDIDSVYMGVCQQMTGGRLATYHCHDPGEKTVLCRYVFTEKERCRDNRPVRYPVSDYRPLAKKPGRTVSGRR